MPFVKGDPRINRKGRPKSFDALRELAQQIAHEEARTAGKNGQPGEPLIIDGHIATVAEMIMRQWATSKDPRLVQAFIAYAFGKVPENVNLTLDLDKLSKDQLKAIAEGEDIERVLKHITTPGGS